MLEVNGLVVRYGPVTAVAGADLKVQRGTIMALLGANGAGKSSLMKAISGLVPAASGTVRIDGEDVTGMSTHKRARLGIAYAMEGRRLFHRMTVEENLRVAWDFRKASGSYRAAADSAYERFPVLAERRNTAAGLLSGGQQQMVVLSAALIHSPRYLLLDEPSLGLAPVIVQQIFGVIEEVCRQQGVTILLSEQVAALALSVANEGCVMRRGALVRQGPARDLAADPSLSAAYLGG
jgi:branched-chain amino acid transport system ATP-binding protein